MGKESAFALLTASAELALSWRAAPHPRCAGGWAAWVAPDLRKRASAQFVVPLKGEPVLLVVSAPCSTATAPLCWGLLRLRMRLWLLRKVKAP